jgi:hypothetical protein
LVQEIKEHYLKNLRGLLFNSWRMPNLQLEQSLHGWWVFVFIPGAKR